MNNIYYVALKGSPQHDELLAHKEFLRRHVNAALKLAKQFGLPNRVVALAPELRPVYGFAPPMQKWDSWPYDKKLWVRRTKHCACCEVETSFLEPGLDKYSNELCEAFASLPVVPSYKELCRNVTGVPHGPDWVFQRRTYHLRARKLKVYGQPLMHKGDYFHHLDVFIIGVPRFVVNDPSFTTDMPVVSGHASSHELIRHHDQLMADREMDGD